MIIVSFYRVEKCERRREVLKSLQKYVIIIFMFASEDRYGFSGTEFNF